MATTTAKPNVSYTGFSVAVLQQLKIPVNAWTVSVLNSVQKAEEPSLGAFSEYNPFNISGGTRIITYSGGQIDLGVNPTGTLNPGNGGPVDQFSGWQDGVTATANFLQQGDPGIVSALQKLGSDSNSGGSASANVGKDVADFFGAVTGSGSFGVDGSTGYSYWQQTYFPYFGGGQVSTITADGFGEGLVSILLGPLGDAVGTPSPASGPNNTAGEPNDISGNNVNSNPNQVGGTPPASTSGCVWSIGGVCVIQNTNFISRLGLGALGVGLIIIGLLIVLRKPVEKVAGAVA